MKKKPKIKWKGNTEVSELNEEVCRRRSKVMIREEWIKLVISEEKVVEKERKAFQE